LTLPTWKSLQASPFARDSIREPQQCAPDRPDGPHDSPRRIARRPTANTGY
jgi:hypothetical protein